MKTKKPAPLPKPIIPYFHLRVDEIKINSNQTVYIRYNVMKMVNGRERLVGRAWSNFNQDLRKFGLGGKLELDLFKDRSL